MSKGVTQWKPKNSKEVSHGCIVECRGCGEEEVALESDEGVLEDYAEHIQESEFVLIETRCSPSVLSQKDRDLNVGLNNNMYVYAQDPGSR